MILNLFLASIAFALQAPDFSVSVTGKEITATPPAGHHFNIQAPKDLVAGGKHLKPKSADEKKVVFQKPSSDDFVISLYLCDDAKTFCEKHQVSAKSSSPHASSAATSETSTASPVFKGTKNGFIFNRPEKALAQAAREKKPLLIDFYGIWCPPCNMFDEEIFSKRDFQRQTSRFIRLKLDADAPDSWALKSKYKVGGYPTVIFATSDADEISRVVGFHPKNEFLKEANLAWENRAVSFSTLKTKADQGDKPAQTTLGKMYLERKEFSLAMTYLSKSMPGSEEFYSAKVGADDESANESKLVDTLQEALRAYPDTANALEWRSKLADVYEKQKQTSKRNEQLELLVASARGLARHPEKLKSTDMTSGDLLETAAAAEEQLGKKYEAKTIWHQAAEQYQNQIGKLGQSQAAGERGYHLELAYCLWKGGEEGAADTLYNRLEKRYPEEFTFYFGHARMKMETKKFEEANKLAQKAFEFSYGDNRLRAAQVLAQSYEALGQKEKGIDTVHEALKTVSLPDDKNIRTHRYVKKLKELESKLLQFN